MKAKKHSMLLLGILLMLIISPTQAQKKINILQDALITSDMRQDTLDIEYFEKNQVNDDLEIIMKNGEKKRQFKTGYEDGYYVERIIPPLPKLYIIYNEYYLNGKIKRKSFQLDNILIGTSTFYDEKGKVIETKDEDQKFGKFDYNKVILFLAQKGHVNIKTGEGRERLGFAYDAEKKIWYTSVVYPERPDLNRIYTINGNSGKVIRDVHLFIEE